MSETTEKTELAEVVKKPRKDPNPYAEGTKERADFDKQLQAMRRARQAMRMIERSAQEKAKKEDDRRKIVAGAVFLKLIEGGGGLARQLTQLLDKGLTRDIDRELFDLAPKTTPEPPPAPVRDVPKFGET